MTKRGMSVKELEKAVDTILLKKARGEKLTGYELRILAYTVYAARYSCGVCL